MRKCAVLGPVGTYASLAAKQLKDNYDIQYYPTILECYQAINEDCDALIPFENTLDGYVMEAVDLIIRKEYHIVEQVKLSVGFHFIGKQWIDRIQKVYVQKKAYGQCLNFILEHHLQPIITQSNMDSLEQFKQSDDPTIGAIVPKHIDTTSYPLAMLDIADRKENETRFVRVAMNQMEEETTDLVMSLVIVPLEDRPGILYSILEIFDQAHINLRSILSRPRRDMIGKYIFYVEIDLNKEQLHLLEKLEATTVSKQCKFYQLGIYNSLKEE